MGVERLRCGRVSKNNVTSECPIDDLWEVTDHLPSLDGYFANALVDRLNALSPEQIVGYASSRGLDNLAGFDAKAVVHRDSQTLLAADVALRRLY